jgi:hypothetical protein
MIVVLAGCAPDNLYLASYSCLPGIGLMNVLLATHALDMHHRASFIFPEPGTINPV